MKKRKLIIVGAAGHGREVAYTFLLNHAAEDFLGFLDDASSEPNYRRPLPHPVVIV
jgi:hypothetical protein